MFESLTKHAADVLHTAYPAVTIEPMWVRPQERSHGDIATSIALRLAKEVGQPPMTIAEALAKGLEGEASIEKVEAVKPGYVNVWLKPEVLVEALSSTAAALTAKKADPKAKPVIVEYSSPNIAKPLAVHHILSTMIGQAIANVYEHTGSNVLHWNYIADWGVQFGQLYVAWKKWGCKTSDLCTVDDFLELYVRFHTEAEKDESLKDAGREAFRELEQGNPEVRQFLEQAVSITKVTNNRLYDRLQVRFDLELGEGFYEDKMAAIIEEGKKKKVFKEGEKGALIVEFPNEKYPPYMIVKGDGGTLYSTRDLAQMRYRMDTYNPEAIFIVTDVAQKLHFEQLEETCTMLGWTLPEFENVIFGRMRFVDKAMSTRKGNVLKLEDVLAEAVDRAKKIIKERGDSIQTDNPDELAEMMGTGALVYGILNQNRKMDIVFDWDKMLSFEGNSAPYLQYTHARARSVLRKAEDESPKLPKTSQSLTEHERLLIGTLLQFPSALEEARVTRMPHKLANFLYQLAQDFNAFYNADTIPHAEAEERAKRLFLTYLTAEVLKLGSRLLAIRVPDRM